MDPRTYAVSRRSSRRWTSTRLEDLEARLDATERRLRQVENTLSYVGRQAAGLTVGSACRRCERSLLIVEDGEMHCPACGYRRLL